MTKTITDNKKIRLAVDAMGGDHAPLEIIKGAKEACKISAEIEILLVGNSEKIKAGFSVEKYPQIKVVDASDIITMNDSAAKAVKAKPNSSIVVGVKLVKEGKADAFISAGNTGAVMTAALLYLGRIRGIKRPAIAAILPTAQRPVVLLDAGANSDCKAEHLHQFALMGHAYSKHVLEVENPSVGLLNIGAEKGKGDDLVKDAHNLIDNSSLNFYGNMEGREISKGITDVIVCDGFIGNVVLKTMEGLASVLFKELKTIINSATLNKVGGFLLAPSLKKMQKRLNHDTYGGAQLLGVNGVCIVSHGSAKQTAIKNAIMFAKKTIEHNVVDKIKMEANL